MINQKNTRCLLFVVLIIVLFMSCTTNKNTYDPEAPYPGMEILRYSNSLVYEFPNADSDKLIIVLEGMIWYSVLGYKIDYAWAGTGIALELLQELRGTHTVLIPEKTQRLAGQDYYYNVEDRKNYTAANLVACYTDSINSYLNEHEYSSIVLVGYYEGAVLMPLVYEKMNNKDKVIAMVAVNSEGLSWYEEFQILSKESRQSREWLNFFENILDTFNPEETEFPDSFEENYLDMTYRYYNSIIHIKPFDYYQNIDIPVYFVCDDYSYRYASESQEYIQENLPEKPFEFGYWDWVEPEKVSQKIKFRKDIAEWILALK